MKNYDDTIGNRTHDLPTCSPVPQPAAPPHAPHSKQICIEKHENKVLYFVSTKSVLRSHADILPFLM
jgi:hypothetical protein